MANKYGIGELTKLIVSMVYTKIFYRKSRLIRIPFNVRGRRSLSGLIGLTTGYACRFDLEGSKNTLQIGDNCQFGDYVHIVALKNICIGNNVLVASKVFISDTSHGNYSKGEHSEPNEVPSKRKLCCKDVNIEDNVWIGENCVILSGVRIGYGSIIGANSVVTKSIPAQSIAVGSPAKVIKYFSENDRKWIRVG